MILLADGGSTKVDWCLVDRGELIKQIFTKGANPFFRTKEDISKEIGDVLMPQISTYNISAVHFFGAGCAFPEKNEIVRSAIADHLPTAIIEVGSDLLAAAKGLCGERPGIACIIGTGSNSCYYNGGEIIENVSPLGFILGDEGSGATIGRLFLGACLKNQLTPGLKEKFLKEFDLTQSDILDKVYKEPLPNRFLASLSPFLRENIQDKTIHNLVYNAFKDFFVKNIMQYDYKTNSVSFTGSIAYHYREILLEVASEMNISINKITKSPMDGLISYYSSFSKTSTINI